MSSSMQPLANHDKAPTPLLQGNPGNIIAAHTDEDAFRAWLSSKGTRSPNTFETYKREAHKLMLWMHLMNLSLHQLTMEHVHQFYYFLMNPPKTWIRSRAKAPPPLATQVLYAPASHKAIAYTRNTLSQAFRFFQDAGYVQKNPFAISASPPVPIQIGTDRFLDLKTWQYFWEWLTDKMPLVKRYNSAYTARARWLFALLYHTGIRRSSVVNGLMSNFVNRDDQWFLKILAKGRKIQAITINSALLEELQRYRTFLGLSVLPTPGEETPLLPSLRGRQKQLTGRNVNLIIDTVCTRSMLDCEDEHIKQQLKQVSPHWLRHTNATHRLMAGASLETTQDELGHTDPRTTRIYAKTVSQQRITDAEKLVPLQKQNGSKHHG